MLVHRIDVAEHALYRTRRASLDVLLSESLKNTKNLIEKTITICVNMFDFYTLKLQKATFETL